MQAMDAIRASKSAEEARRHAATLQRLTAATRASMEQHVRAEEQEVCFYAPALLIQGCTHASVGRLTGAAPPGALPRKECR